MLLGSLAFSSVITLTNVFGSVAVDTRGAFVSSYVPRDGQEVFFRQSGPRTDAWYNGGVPICWPWFNQQGDPGSVQHGFARQKEWTLVSREDAATESRMLFRLEEKGYYRLDYEVLLGRSLSLRLVMRNIGQERFVVTTGLHPYFAVSDPRNVTVAVPDKVIACQPGMDGGLPYGEGTYEVYDKGTGRRLSLQMIGSKKLIIWNVGPDAAMVGMAPDDWKRYICVEPAVIPRANGYFLHPGEERSIGFVCTVSYDAKK